MGLTRVAVAASPLLTFNFTVSQSGTTSAGVYDASTPPHLVRTLWRKVYYAAGSYTADWDYKDDYGNVLPAGSY